jgi:hypothetical protein
MNKAMAPRKITMNQRVEGVARMRTTSSPGVPTEGLTEVELADIFGSVHADENAT